MPKLVCRQCDFSTIVSPKMARFGMMCPECHCGNLKPLQVRRTRRGDRDIAIRPNAIRALIGGVILILVGVALFAWGAMHWKVAGRFGARMTAYGAVLIVAGLISCAAGAFGVIRDLFS